MVTRFFFLFFVLLVHQTSAQIEYPGNIFREPMDLPIELSGSFSELRSVNFHSGIDIRVINRPHRRVYAVGDGYVSRIKVEPAGYGNAIYITHPQGYVSVYAHLDYFTKEIENIIKETQYRLKSFSIDISFPEDSLPVKQSDVIGIAGNTGYSFGAHLHFEIRDVLTEEPIDPLLFGFTVKDNSAPQFRELKIYPHGNSLINNKNDDLILKTTKQNNGKYAISSIPEASGAISFGIEVLDKQNSSNPNRLGLKMIQIFVDDSLLVDVRFEKLNFSVVRHQLAYIDCPEMERSKKRFQRSWKKPGNNLPIYHFIRDEGILYIHESKLYKTICIIEDIGGNTTELVFNIKGSTKTEHSFAVQCNDPSVLFRWDTINTWSDSHTQVIFEKGTLFSDECITIRESDYTSGQISPKLELISEEALAGYFKIKMQPFQSPESSEGLTIALSDSKKNQFTGIKTEYNNGWFEASARSFGTYVIVLDTIPPEIKPVMFPANGVVTSQKKLSFKVTDNICGIESYNAYINDEWILLQYNLKDDEMFYIIDEKLPKGNSIFKLMITDHCGNTSILERNLTR